MGSTRGLGDVVRSNGIPSMILGMMPSGKKAAVNLVVGERAVITGKPIGDQNIEIMSFGVDMIVFERDYGISPSGSHINSTSLAEKNHDSSLVNKQCQPWRRACRRFFRSDSPMVTRVLSVALPSVWGTRRKYLTTNDPFVGDTMS
jgi:hypothetical protein